jgi:hypothetical protein
MNRGNGPSWQLRQFRIGGIIAEPEQATRMSASCDRGNLATFGAE